MDSDAPDVQTFSSCSNNDNVVDRYEHNDAERPRRRARSRRRRVAVGMSASD
ncbi:MAG: hypothetical protein Q8K63_12905 [Acidimicrobiales bacterium]|nr:hypothetical protein [Acidimicrobiales bacterium]